MSAYQVRNWDGNFERAETRKCVRMRWIAIPNKHDGKGFRRIVAHERNTDVFTAWMMIVQVASKMHTRGLLVDEDGPLTSEDLSLMTGFPEEIFELAIPVLVQIGWLKKVDCPEVSGCHPEASG